VGVVLAKKGVQAVHLAVELAIGRAVQIGLSMVPLEGPNQTWWRASAGSEVVFELQPKNDNVEYVEFPNRTRMSGIRLHPDLNGDVIAVFGYQERWTCSRADQFALRDASITAGLQFLRGQAVPLIRADWDARDPGQGVPRTQPHWNAVDNSTSDGMWSGQEGIPDGSGMAEEEVPASEVLGTRRPRLEGLHWPMGGWKNPAVPSQWYQPCTQAALPVWGQAVVEHLRDELGNERYLRFSA